ncbi:MAG TPA: oligosaccharide flippase family protein [Thermoleophilaceae bacterium]|nr:oligosaccharide flippase family protein [Thermoleophilaceae bacterium]
MLGARGVLVYSVGAVANIVLARLLTPRDFGIFALGLVVVVAGTFLAEGGFAGALIKRPEPPEPRELQAVTALQLGVTTLLAVLLGLAAIPLGRDVELIALMAVSLPIAIARAPSMIVLERRLEYRVIATADLVEALVFYAWAIGAVAVGLGVWGLASAVVLRSVAGSAVVLATGPLGLVLPRWSWEQVRPLLGFGVKLQLSGLITVSRDQLLNVGVGAVAGLGTLGVWTLASRVMQVPALLFQTVGRVSFPAMSRLLGSNADPRRVLERQVAAVAAVNAVLIVAVVGFAPALPTIVGDEWHQVPAVLLWSGIGLMIGAPVIVTGAGFLLAAGMPGKLVRANAAGGAVWLAVALPLLGPLGAPAVGIGWVASSMVSAVLLWRPVAARTGAKIGARMAIPLAISLAAVAVGWFVAHQPDDRVVGGCLGLVAGELIVLAGLLTVSRPALRELRSLAGQGLRSFRGVRG